jgi:hypothetical protein
MTNKLELARHLVPFVMIQSSVPVAEALKVLHDAGTDFAVIGEVQQPQTLIQHDHLVSLAGDQQRSLAEVIERLPPLIIIDGEPGELNSEEVGQLASLLGETEAAGVVIYQDKQVKGVISWEAFSDALPLSAISSTTVRGLYEGLAGNPVLPARIYVCLKCAASEPPAPFAVPREGDEAPVCPKHWIHGRMKRKDA